MKKELQFNQITILLGLCTCLVGLILTPIVDNISSESSGVGLALSLLSGTYLSTILSMMLIVLLGGTFIFAKNSVVKYIGYGLCAFSLFFGLPLVAQGTSSTGMLIFGIGTILMSIGVVLYVISIALDYFDVY